MNNGRMQNAECVSSRPLRLLPIDGSMIAAFFWTLLYVLLCATCPPSPAHVFSGRDVDIAVDQDAVLKDIDMPEEYQKYTKRTGPDES
jgi:hypothetical protein